GHGARARPVSVVDRLILDRYRLTERFAVGGSAEVWRARDENLERDVAVKLLHPHLLPDERSRGRMAAEARAVAALSHPGIVGVYDVDVAGEVPALVMELVEGESLSARLERDGPLPAADAARIVAEVSDALYHAHQRGVVHRDVKPGNILLSRDGRARLVDFGIAHSLAPSAERLTQTGNVMGTLRYMAPEQLAGGDIGPRTDLYGLGTVLHEALTGQPPFAAATPVALAEAQRGPLPAMEGIDPALVAVTHACLALEPTQRPLHAGALADSLRAWLAGIPVQPSPWPLGLPSPLPHRWRHRWRPRTPVLSPSPCRESSQPLLCLRRPRTRHLRRPLLPVGGRTPPRW
ncbi:MAG: serine/threonine-protein kinase, partial [Candidatus Limnocylindria bacterium]